MKLRIAAGVLTGLLLSSASAQASPTVSLRVEGQNGTLLAQTKVELDSTTPEPNTGCPGDSVAAVLERGTNGNWSRATFVTEILDEVHGADFSKPDYWGFSVFRENRYQAFDAGVCDERVAVGEEILAAYNVSDADYNPTRFPLAIRGLPVTVKPGEPVTVRVDEFFCKNQYCAADADGTQDGYPRPRGGAVLEVNGTQVTTKDDGTATLTLTGRGPVQVRATADGDTPSRIEQTCVTDGNDGYCATPSPVVLGPCVSTGDDGLCGTRDRRAPEARITGIAEQQRFVAGRGPRVLTAEVPADPSGLHQVKLRLTRRAGGRCSYYSGGKEAFVASRCGRSFPFKVTAENQVSYLLPARLPRGRYVLDVLATDKAFNRDALARGRNRIAFFVG